MACNPFRGRLTNAPRRCCQTPESEEFAVDASWCVGNRDAAEDTALLGWAYPRDNQLPNLAGYALGLRGVLVGPLPAATQQMIDYLLHQAAFFAWHVMQWTSFDAFLFDIPRTEFQYRREFRPRVHLRIADLQDDIRSAPSALLSFRSS